MAKTILGLDIGSNSVGSAWIDTEKREIYFGVSVFPAGVEESDTNRGAPRNQKRRQARSGRRSTERRAMRKHRLRHVLSEADLLPGNTDEIREFLKNNPSLLRCELEKVKDFWHEFFNMNPWHLRRAALQKELTPYEFGRMLVHLNQRRGAVGFDADADDEGKVKGGIDKVRMQLLNSYGSPEEKARLSTLHDSEDDETRDSFVPEFSAWIRDSADVTFGRMMADELDTRSAVYKPIRNRRESFAFHADRALIRQEFERVWEKQKSFGGKLAQLLTAQLKKRLDDPDCDSYAANTKDSWRHGGAIFGQRRTYWDTGTLGRCDLEPTEHRCPHADMHAQHYRVVETVNNIRINDRPLNLEERELVITALRSQKTGSVTTVRRALGINKKAVKHLYRLNLENDSEREINTDWFYREIVLNSFGEDAWQSMSQNQRESVNRAVLKFDPTQEGDVDRLFAGAVKWWGLTEESAKCFVDAWKHRPKIEKRLKLSRTAIRNLLPYMSQFDEENDRWPTQIEARQAFASDMENSATTLQRERYTLSGRLLTKADRHYMKMHPDELPPAPNLANPVVRKAIHEVRRHVNEYLRRFGKPDRVVIELAREARQSAKVRNKQLASNRRREGERKKIEKDLLAWGIRESNWPSAIRRIRLCKEQNGICPFSIEGANRDRGITPKMAAEGRDVEIEHIIPQSRSGPTMNFNNIVLCFRDANRDKADKTPYEWLGPSKLETVLHRLEKTDVRKNVTKWANLTAKDVAATGFSASQLTDTAYASRQVAAYLRDALFPDDPNDERRGVFTTKGQYTAVLRRDWGLLEEGMDRSFKLIAMPEGDERREVARREKKDRSNHWHHAVDAVVIAFTTGSKIDDLAHFVQEQEHARANLGRWPKRQRLDPPWGTVEEFREIVLTRLKKQIVSHRPVKRKLIGPLHKEMLNGPVVQPLPTHRTENPKTLFTRRIYAEKLQPNHLRVPVGWDDLSRRIETPGLAQSLVKAIRKQLAALEDPSPTKSGIVRDRTLRDCIRKCLRDNAVDPDAFSKDDIKRLIDKGKLRTKRRDTKKKGVPISRVVLLWTHVDPVIVSRKRWDHEKHEYVPDADPRTLRVYESRNNHHVEILEDTKTQKWSGCVVTAFEAAARVRPPKRSGRTKQPAVNRSDRNGKRFVMSIAEGEMIYMKNPDTGEPGYFVLAKLDKQLHFVAHWDARPATVTKTDRAKGKLPRVLHSFAPSKLAALGLNEAERPYKVAVSPLGDIRTVND